MSVEHDLTQEEFDRLYELAHLACEGFGPCVREDLGELLMRALNKLRVPKT